MSKLVYICDDNTDILTVCSLILSRKQDYVVKTFTASLPMISALGEEKPCCIFLDHSLPDLSTAEAVKRAKSENSDLKVILFTANNEARQIAIKAHTDDVLPKPFEIKDFIAMVEKYCD